MIKVKKDNHIFWFQSQELLDMANCEKSFTAYSAFAFVVVNVQENRVVKSRYPIEHLVDLAIEGLSNESEH